MKDEINKIINELYKYLPDINDDQADMIKSSVELAAAIGDKHGFLEAKTGCLDAMRREGL